MPSLTEKDFPSQNNWIFVPLFEFLLTRGWLIPFIFATPFIIHKYSTAQVIVSASLMGLVTIIFLGGFIFNAYMKRRNFHFVLSEQFFQVNADWPLKWQANWPINMTQEVQIKQSFIETQFGLVRVLVISNEFTITIPGLKPADAERLKTAISGIISSKSH